MARNYTINYKGLDSNPVNVWGMNFPNKEAANKFRNECEEKHKEIVKWYMSHTDMKYSDYLHNFKGPSKILNIKYGHIEEKDGTKTYVEIQVRYTEMDVYKRKFHRFPKGKTTFSPFTMDELQLFDMLGFEVMTPRGETRPPQEVTDWV